MTKFKLCAPYQPAGDQVEAINQLTQGINQKATAQVLLGVTGSGKTYTMANVIANTNKPTLVIAHNKTLAGQLYQELRDFFPENAVSYFVSYYDYYQPEAYISATDTYIEKEATINDEIDKLRLSATTNLLTRPDSIVIASVSCIYNLGSPADYANSFLEIIAGELISRESILQRLQALQYQNSPYDLKRATYRIKGDVIQVWSANEDTAWMIDTLDDRITSITKFEPDSGRIIDQPSKAIVIYPAKHHVIMGNDKDTALAQIKKDLQVRLQELRLENKIIEAYRLEQKVNYDLEQIMEFGFVNGIENYTRYFDGRQTGEPPFTLIDYFWENCKIFNQDSFLTIIDESHISLPQVRGMFFGDFSRKQNLIKYGFRLPSALDNRPLKFHEFLAKNQQFIFVSATPAEWEIKYSDDKIIEQLVRPTGLVDPEIEVRPTQNQINDLIKEIYHRKKIGQRVLVTVLTKKMAETLTDFLNDEIKMKKFITDNFGEQNWRDNPLPQVAYLHSDVETLDRSDILNDLREGKYDVLVGINLLREGLDLPEVSLVAILDADKEGFLRSTTSLIQTIGRAARHLDGRAILYADKITNSMQIAIDETKRRRAYQLSYNEKHQITPTTINKIIREKMINRDETKKQNQSLGEQLITKNGKKTFIINLDKKTQINVSNFDPDFYTPHEKKALIKKMRRRMNAAAEQMDYELAAIIRDMIKLLEKE